MTPRPKCRSWKKELTGVDEELAAAIKAFQAAEDGAGDFADSAQDATDQISDFADAADDASGDVDDFSDSVDDAGEASLNFSDILKAGILSDAIMSGFRKLLEGAKDFASGMIESAKHKSRPKTPSSSRLFPALRLLPDPVCRQLRTRPALRPLGCRKLHKNLRIRQNDGSGF